MSVRRAILVEATDLAILLGVAVGVAYAVNGLAFMSADRWILIAAIWVVAVVVETRSRLRSQLSDEDIA